MGADVMLGKDEHCRRWLTAFPRGAGRGLGGRRCRAPTRGERRRAARGQQPDEPTRLVVFTPSGKRGRFALGTPVLTAARQLGVDIDSRVRRAGDLRAVPGDGGRGQLRQARHHSARPSI